MSNTPSPFYSSSGKWYRRPNGHVVPSAGSICTAISRESFDHVGIQTLERAILHGEGAHEVACNFSLYRLGHYRQIQALPPMPAECPLTTPAQWDAAMTHALKQVEALFDKYEVEPIAVEEPSICSTYGFGGQPDIKLDMTWKKKRERTVWDYKRVAALSLSHLLKIECYRMLDGYKDCKRGFIAWLRKDDDAQLKEIKPNAAYHAAICGQAAVMNLQISERILRP